MTKEQVDILKEQIQRRLFIWLRKRNTLPVFVNPTEAAKEIMEMRPSWVSEIQERELLPSIDELLDQAFMNEKPYSGA